MSEPTRNRNNSTKKTEQKSNRGQKRVCIPVEQDEYQAVIEDNNAFRAMLDEYIIEYPAIFPPDITQGYKLNGWMPESTKIPDVCMRRICLHALDDEGKKQIYNIAPSFIMPYMVGYTEDVEKALFLHEKFGVPFWGLTYVFDHDDSYWERMIIALGRCHLVGTTVKDPAKLPNDILADETCAERSRSNGERVCPQSGHNLRHRPPGSPLLPAWRTRSDGWYFGCHFGSAQCKAQCRVQHKSGGAVNRH